MRQFFSFDDKLINAGDFALIYKENQKALLINYDNSRVALCSNSGTIPCGIRVMDIPGITDSFPFIRNFDRSYVYMSDKNITDGLWWCGVDINGWRIINDPCDIPVFFGFDDNTILGNAETETTISEDREDRGMFFADNYEMVEQYSGFHCYHYHHDRALNKPIRPYRGHRIGIELEVEFNTSSARTDFCDKPSNWFYCESDGSLGLHGCEIISIPLLPIDAKSEDFWRVLTDSIADEAKSWDTGRCGLHVHIGREILGRNEEQQSETIGKLLYLYHHYVKDTRLNVKIYGRERGYCDHDGKTSVGDAAKIFGGEVFKIKNASQKVRDSMIGKSNGDRYFDINIRNPHTIEFRKGRGSINPRRISMVVAYSERLCIYAKNTPWQQISYDDFVAFLRATVDNEYLKTIIEGWA